MNNTQDRRRRKRSLMYGTGLITVGAVASLGTAYALSALQVTTEILPAVGQAEVQSCDASGVSVTYEYGPTNNKGIRVSTVNVSNIDDQCSLAVVEFVDNDTVVSTASGAISNGMATVNPPSIFTDEFNNVRVSLMP